MPEMNPAELRWNVLDPELLALFRTATRQTGKAFLASDLVLTVVEPSREAQTGARSSLGAIPSSDYRSGSDWNERTS